MIDRKAPVLPWHRFSNISNDITVDNTNPYRGGLNSALGMLLSRCFWTSYLEPPIDNSAYSILPAFWSSIPVQGGQKWEEVKKPVNSHGIFEESVRTPTWSTEWCGKHPICASFVSVLSIDIEPSDRLSFYRLGAKQMALQRGTNALRRWSY